MKLIYPCLFTLMSMMGCQAQEPPSTDSTAKISQSSASVPLASYEDVVLGAEQMEVLTARLMDQRVGLVVNHTAMVGDSHLADTLIASGISVKRIFAPEHGFRGTASAGAHIEDGVDTRTGVTIRSLHGKHKRPKPEWLADLDVVVFDIQDVGVRFYTYLTTMHYMMEGCAEAGVDFIVLDRPNPHGYYIDGPLLDTAYRSFVGWLPVPIVHGMTLGEMARMIVGEGWLEVEGELGLEVIAMKDYRRDATYALPIPPSPNLPNHRAVMLYPSICLFEATVFSIGRGTPHPFQVMGAPGYTEGTFHFIPKPNPGARHPKHEGELCKGHSFLELSLDSLTSKRVLWLTHWSALSAQPDRIDRPEFFDLLMGTDQVRRQLLDEVSMEAIRASWQADLRRYDAMRQAYLLYR